MISNYCEKRKKEGKRCRKEINPKYFPETYFGEPWVYNENEYACYLCKLDERRETE